jgi:polyvinyl alcohol dehydrogenase (cytochrome)
MGSSKRLSAVNAGRALALTSLFLVACNSEEKPTGSTTGPGSVRAVDWPMLGYDLGSTYFNKAETKISTANAGQMVKAWEFDTLSGCTGTPVISGGRVYVSANPGPSPDDQSVILGGVRAIELATGVEVWRNTEAGGVSSLALDQDVLYLHDGSGNIKAFDAANGHERWSYKTDDNPNIQGFSSPIVTKDLVMVGGSGLEEVALPAGTPATFRGFIVALHKDGSLAWKKYTVEPPATGVGIWSTLSADEAMGIVIAGTGNNYTGEPTDTSDAFVALPLADGADFRWKAQILTGDVYVSRQSNGNPDGDFGANPILFEVNGRKLAAGGAKMGDVFVVDRMTGEIIKQRNVGTSSAFKGGIFNNGAWDGSSVLVACNALAGPSTLFALDPLTLDIKWERPLNGPVYGPISVANGVGFVGDNNVLHVFDTATGDMLMEFQTEGTISTAPAISDGYVVFGSGMPWIQSINGTKYYALKVP